METETQRPKNERTPGDPVGEGRREPWERAPRPPFRPAPFPAGPGRADGYISPDDRDNLDDSGNFAGPSRADGFRPVPWREPQVANLREPQDPFQAANPRSSEILRSPQPRKKRAPGFFFFLIGGLLLLTAAVFTAINLVEAEQARRATAALIDALPSELSEELSARPSLEAKDSSKRPEPDWPMPQRIVNGEEIIGVIEIPRTGLMLPVLSSWDYDKLKRYPCYYHGSIYRKDAVFCSHDYPFQFGGLNVLEDGDEARFLDADGNIFTYAFREQEYLQPTDVEAMTFKDDWDLTLFTCAYNGLARYAYRFEETGFRAKP